MTDNPLTEAHRQAVPGTRWRHKKRGTEYTVVGRAVAQAPDDTPIADYNGVIVYRCERDGQLWVRHIHEFEDGRFERIDAAALPAPADRGADVEEALALATELESLFYRGKTLSNLRLRALFTLASALRASSAREAALVAEMEGLKTERDEADYAALTLSNDVSELGQKLADMEAGYLRRHKDAVDRFEAIATLTADLNAAREALKPFAAMADVPTYPRAPDAFAWGFNDAELYWGDFQRARAALSTAKPEGA